MRVSRLLDSVMYSWKTVLVTIGLLFGLKVWNPYLIENITWSWFDFLHQQHEIEKVETATEADFQVFFVDAMSFPHGSDPFPNLFGLFTEPKVIESVGDESNRRGRRNRRRS